MSDALEGNPGHNIAAKEVMDLLEEDQRAWLKEGVPQDRVETYLSTVAQRLNEQGKGLGSEAVRKLAQLYMHECQTAEAYERGTESRNSPRW